MSPAVGPGDYVLVNRWAYRSHAPEVGDLAVLRNPEREGQFLCERVAHRVERMGRERGVVQVVDPARDVAVRVRHGGRGGPVDCSEKRV